MLLLLFISLPALAVTPNDWKMSAPEVLEEGHLYSASALLVDGDTGEVLFAKNATQRMYPASTTKIMTLLLGLESGIDLKEKIIIPDEAADIPEGSSVVPVKPGEAMTFEDLLYGFMMRSGNDGANAVAVLTSGSVEAFVDRMNQRAKEMGCTDTHFVNAHGYHDENHYTTAMDLARISLEAMKNPDFRKIVGTDTYTMAVTQNREALVISTRNDLLRSKSKYYYPDARGIKTGHHTQAGQCLVGAAERDGKLLISVALNSNNNDETLKWYDTARLFEYGYTCYQQTDLSALLKAADLPTQAVSGGDPKDGKLTLALSDLSDPYLKVPVLTRDGAVQDTAARLMNQAVLTISDPLEAPVTEGDKVGSFSLTLSSGEQVTADLLAANTVHVKPVETPTPAPTASPTPIPVVTAAPEKSGPASLLGILVPALLGTLAVILGTVIIAALASARKEARRREALRRRRSRPGSRRSTRR